MGDVRDPAALEALRARIDVVDARIVELLAERAEVVARIALLKPDAESVHAPERVEEVIQRVRGLAESHGVDPAIVEGTYRSLIEALTDLQRRILASGRPGARSP
jgi:isochorismate pyruvate lyase